MNKERRNFPVTELRVEERDEKREVIGHASLFNSLSEDLGGFREMIEPGAFDSVLQDDVRALFNHDPNLVLARTKSGTLRLSVDDNGLQYRFEPPDTTAGKDLLVSLERGDIDQSSFGFRVKEDKWEERDGEIVRIIKKFERLFDVSPVTFPAYPDTDVAKRELRDFMESKHPQKETQFVANGLRDIQMRKLKHKKAINQITEVNQ
jgi:uncharacterized protein